MINGNIENGARIHLNLTQELIDITYMVNDKENEPKIGFKLEVKGSIGDFVSIDSDADIEANVIGKRCRIKSEYGAITAKSIGFETEVNVCNAIEVTDTAEFVVLSSKQKGLKAANLGAIVTVHVQGEIEVGAIGLKSKLTSEQKGLKAKNVGHHVVIQTKKQVEIDKLDYSCTVESLQSSIKTGDQVGCCSLTAHGAITTGAIGDYTNLNSYTSKVEVLGLAGNYVVISAHETVDVQDLGMDVTISAGGEINIHGVCTIPSTLRLYKLAEDNQTKVLYSSIPSLNLSDATKSQQYFG